MNLPDAGPSESTKSIDWSIKCLTTSYASSLVAITIETPAEDLPRHAAAGEAIAFGVGPLGLRKVNPRSIS
jgi:hypothetical protein